MLFPPARDDRHIFIMWVYVRCFFDRDRNAPRFLANLFCFFYVQHVRHLLRFRIMGRLGGLLWLHTRVC